MYTLSCCVIIVISASKEILREGAAPCHEKKTPGYANDCEGCQLEITSIADPRNSRNVESFDSLRIG